MRRIRLIRSASLALLGTLATVVTTVGCQHNSNSGTAAVTEPVTLRGSQIADVQMALGRTMEARGQSREALPLFAEAAKNDPTRADVWVRLAVNSDKEGLFAESGEHYRKALEREPNNPDIYCNMGYSMYLQQRFAEAESALRRAIELKPDHTRAQNNLGLVLARVGKMDESLVSFRRAGCSQTDAHTNLAYGLTLRGSISEANEHYDRALALDPNSEGAKKGRGELVAVAGKSNPPTSMATPASPTANQSAAAHRPTYSGTSVIQPAAALTPPTAPTGGKVPLSNSVGQGNFNSSSQSVRSLVER